MKALGLLIFSLTFGLTAAASLGPYAPRFWFSTTYQDVFYGSDCYADGSPVLEGECYALVWQANDAPFRGFYASGTYGLSSGGQSLGTLPVDPENCHVLEVWPAAQQKWIEPEKEGEDGYWTAYCPGASNVVQRQYYVDHVDTGHFAVYLFDTRVKIGEDEIALGCDATTRTVPMLNAYGVVSGLENIEMVPGSDYWKWNITTKTGDFNPYGTALPSYGDFNDEFDVVPTYANQKTRVIVTFDATGGEVEEESRELMIDDPLGKLPVPTRDHYDFVGWFTAKTGGEQVTAETAAAGMLDLFAHWTPITYQISYELNGGENAESNPTNYTIESSKIVLAAPTREGYVFDGWTPDEGVIEAGSTGDRTFTAEWNELFTVTFDPNGGEVGEDEREVEDGETVGDLPVPSRDGWSFGGWFTAKKGGERVTPETVIVGETTFFAQWEERGSCVGAYLKLDLVKDLDIAIDANYAAGDKVTVKVEGLAKGLKLVATQLKETTGAKAVTNVVYTIEGVPTESVDFSTQTMYARVSVTYADKTKEETLQPLPLDIAPSAIRTLTAGALSEPYGPIGIATLWPEVADASVNPKDWSFKTWPTGLKYNATAKDVAWSYKTADGTQVKTSAGPYTLYGVPTKAGEYPIVATHKVKLADGKTTVSETYAAVLTVWGDDGATTYRYVDQAYVETEPKVLGATVKSVSGQPTGVKWTTKDIPANLATLTPPYDAYSLYGTPTKAGVFATTLTKVDPENAKKTVKETFLWKVADGENGGFLSTMDWPVKDAAVTVMQGVIQQNWTCTLPADAKVTATGLPTGLALKQDKKTGEWTLAGTPTKEGNYVVTFKTVRNGVTVTERLSMIVEANAWTGTWYAEQFGEQDASRLGEVTVSANGSVKFVLTEATTNENAKGVVQSSVKKTTVTVKNLDANGKTATLVLPRDKKDPLSEDRTCVINFERNRIIVDDVRLLSLFEKETTDEYCVGYWSEVTTIVAEEVLGTETNAYAYVTVTFDAKKRSFKLQGKLWDGTAVNATANLMLCDVGPSTSPVLVIDKAKNAVLMTFVCDDQGRVAVSFVENGKGVTIGRMGFEPWSEQFRTVELKSKKFNQLTDATQLVVTLPADALETSASTGGDIVDAVVPTASQEIVLSIPAKSLTTAVSAQGLVKFTLTDADGWKWVCELLPVNNGGELQFRGIATGTRKDPVTKKNVTQVCPVFAREREADPE